jgi:hypothetical protein
MLAALTLVREVIGNLRLLGKEIRLSLSGNLRVNALGMALLQLNTDFGSLGMPAF